MKKVQLSLLGPCTLLSETGEEIPIKTRKSWALLALLARAPGMPVLREELAALLWSDSGEEQARASLRQEVAVLRRSLAPFAPEAISSNQGSLQLNLENFEIDTESFWRLTGSDPCAAVALYRGPFLNAMVVRSGGFDDWLQLEIERYRDAALGALLGLLATDMARDALPAAAETATAILRLDPAVEDAHKALMLFHIAQGAPDLALRQYKRCQEALHRELDVAPGQDLQDLAQSLRGAARLPAPAEPSTAWREEKREVSVLAVLVRDAARMSEAPDADPEDMLIFADTFRDDVNKVVAQFGGRLIESGNGRAIAVFGFPQASEFDLENALRAAQALMAQSTTAGLSCGLAQNKVLVRQAPNDPTAPDLTGGPIMMAAELAQLADPGGILVTAEVGEALRHKVAITEVAGRSDILGIVGPLAEPEQQPAGPVRDRSGHFVGREEELALLGGLWEGGTTERVQIGLITGEPGIGKSRLARAFLDSISPKPLTQLTLSGSPHRTGSALWPIRTGRVVAGHAATTYDEQSETDAPAPIAEATVESALSDVWSALGVGPSVLLIEDAHWFDHTSLDVLDQLVKGRPAGTLLILITSRTNSMAATLPAQGLIHISLDRLKRPRVRELVELLGSEKLGSKITEELVRRSSGNPLFVVELVRTMLREGDGARRKVPQNLRASLMARLDEAQETWPTLSAAAAIGPAFDFSLLQQILSLDRETLESQLNDLQEAGLILRFGRPPNARYEFRHALFQEFAYSMMLNKARMQCHSRIA
ncbi:MAG: BTAD domain-containing putative transcriptional regulator, partial [Rhodobacterales bacterium]